VEVTREEAEFKPIMVNFVIESREELERIYGDFTEIGKGNCVTKQGTTWSVTDNLCGDIADQLKAYLED